MIHVREAVAADLPAICEVFHACYGESYTYPEFFDPTELETMLARRDMLILVADEAGGAGVVGTASVVLGKGASSDRVGEFGRLAVLPRHRRRGIGRRLMEARLARVRDRLHVGLVEVRVGQSYSARIAQGQGFAPVGFLPMNNCFGERREHIALLARYFDGALALRRNRPRIAPEIHRLALAAVTNVGLDPDVIVDEDAPPYPPGGPYSFEPLTRDGYCDLLRIERGRLTKRRVFGPLRLDYGFSRLVAEHSDYLIARDDDGEIAAAIGFAPSLPERSLRVFQLICREEAAIRSLLAELFAVCRAEGDLVSIEIDVRADAPRLQRTLLEMGFVAAAYVPALAFHRGRRLDVVKLFRLLVPLAEQRVDLISPARELAALVLAAFTERGAPPTN